MTNNNENIIFLAIGGGLLIYFCIMDVILHKTLQCVSLAKPPEKDPIGVVPIYPLSVKFLTSDYVNNYILAASTEVFDSFTQFSKIFYFISPNMISIIHLCTGLLAAKFVYSDSLQSRRIAVVLYEFRMWLDDLDGTVYRHRANDVKYISNHSTLGFWVDSFCDTTAAVVFILAVLFYLMKYPPIYINSLVTSHTLPWKASGDGVDQGTSSPSCKVIFWRCLCYGFGLALAALTWDRTVVIYEEAFETQLKSDLATTAQSIELHSSTTWTMFALWRMLQGHSWIQLMLAAIFIDKVFEFFRIAQYVLLPAVVILNLLTQVHITHVRHKIGL